MNRLKLVSLALCALACKTTEPAVVPHAATAPTADQAAQSAQSARPPPLPVPAGLDAQAMNPAADPCTDFYEFACGGWMASTEIPADRPRWSRGFLTVQERNELILRQLLDGLAAGEETLATPSGKKVGDYYGSCMDETALEQNLPALQAELKKFARLSDPVAVTTAVAGMHRQALPAVFSFSSTQDFKDVTQVIGEVDQGGLGLPDRDYYLLEDAKTQSIRAAYLEYVTTVFRLLGEKDPAASAHRVLQLETSLAKAALSLVDRREPQKLYHPTDREGLRKLAPTFRWDLYFTRLGAPAPARLNVTHLPYLTAVDQLIKTTRPEVWKAYLSFSLVRSVNDALPRAFRDAWFAFESKALTGAQQDLPRWKKCIAATDLALGEALAQPFIARTFGAEGKQITSEMVTEIEKAFERNLDSLAWMDQPTRELALVKVRKITNKIGYPDAWRNYDALAVERGNFLQNLLRAGAFEQHRLLSKIGKPVDRGEWLMTPPTVNAYYNPPMNEIVFPAGILQPPFFNREAFYPVNFGAMGMVVGHEITHGFDDEGRQFDAEGNLRQWWTQASNQAFNQRAACVEKQYSAQTAIDELKVNGKLTLGENTADLGGIKLAFLAMQAYAERQPALPEARFSAPQQFFLGYAQSWCSKYRDEFARVRAVTDPHSPPHLRVNVPLRNFPPFAQAFSCPAGAPMALPEEQRCAVW